MYFIIQLKYSNKCNSFSTVAVTNYHRLIDFKQHNFIILWEEPDVGLRG